MARNRDTTRYLIVHCAATRAHQDVGVRTINRWHLERGIHSDRGLTGYHYVIRRSGVIELGRDLEAIGAHALGYNDESVGICLVGGVKKVQGELVPDDNFTPDQLQSLEALLRVLHRVYPEAVVLPHNAVSSKACPSFDVWTWQRRLFGADDQHRALAMLARHEETTDE